MLIRVLEVTVTHAPSQEDHTDNVLDRSCSNSVRARNGETISYCVDSVEPYAAITENKDLLRNRSHTLLLRKAFDCPIH